MTEIAEIDPIIEDLKGFKGVLEYESGTSGEDEDIKDLFSKSSKKIGSAIEILQGAVGLMKKRGQTY